MDEEEHEKEEKELGGKDKAFEEKSIVALRYEQQQRELIAETLDRFRIEGFHSTPFVVERPDDGSSPSGQTKELDERYCEHERAENVLESSRYC